MRRQLAGLSIIAALLTALLPHSLGQAACRPTTLADLYPNGWGKTETTQPGAESTTATGSETVPTDPTDLTVPTVPTVPIDPTAPTVPTDATSPTEVPVAQAVHRCRFVYRMLHPINGPSGPGSEFGADRPDVRKHQGVDITAEKMTPVVAVRDGLVTWMLDEAGGDCCAIAVRHDDGWISYYIHLNNDTAGTDDGLMLGIAPGLALGTRVSAGQLLGWVGDSGNAEPAVSHLHFELRTPWGVAVDPAASLWAALGRIPNAQPDANVDFLGPFLDDEQDPAAFALALLTSLGAAVTCDDSGVRACPEALATGWDVIEWSRSMAGGTSGVGLGDLIAAGYTAAALVTLSQHLGEEPWCFEFGFCIDQPVTWRQALGYVAALGGWSDAQAPAVEFIDSAMPCNDPGGPITRAELAQMLARAYGYLPALPCDRVV